MPREQILHHAFNRGEVDKSAMARVDVARLQLAAEVQENLLPYVVGKARFRAGTEYLGTTKSNLFAQSLPFVFSITDTALLELTALLMRAWVSDALVTRNSVDTSIDNGTMDADTAWTLATSGGATAVIGSGVLTMAAPSRGGRATATNEITIAAPDQGVEHGLRINVTRGPIIFRCGSTSGAEDFIATRTLRTGEYSFAFTPIGATAFVQFENTLQVDRIVDSIEIESSGVIELTTPWPEAVLTEVRGTQSAGTDVIFCAADGYQQRRIERYSTNEWAVVLYEADDGPYLTGPSADRTLTPSATTGNITITSDVAFFLSGHVGSLIKMTHTNLDQSDSLSAENTFSEPFEVTGVDAARNFTWTISGLTGSSTTVTLQRSFDGPDSGFTDIESKTSDITDEEETDTFDNQSVWYRAGIKTGDYSSGTQVISFEYPGGGGDGVVRITAVATTTSASAEVVLPLKSTNGTKEWVEGRWSSIYGWPVDVGFFDGRLFWIGKDKVWGSVSDAYHTFDVNTVGDSGPILRDIATGSSGQARWLLPLQRLIIGTESSEVSARASSFDEPLTPTAFSLKDASTQGASSLEAMRIDTFGIFVQRSGKKVYEMVFNIEFGDYTSNNITRLNSEISGDGFTDVAVQRQPDTRVWYVRADGVAAVLLYEREEGVTGWFKIITAATAGGAGVIEGVEVLPAASEDRVYQFVQRTIGGGTVRYLEKLALESEAVGGSTNKIGDSFVFNAGPVTTMTGLDHLEGETVVVWGNSKFLGSYTVVSGSITLSESATNVCAGLSYDWRFKSAKLAYGSGAGTSLLQKKRVDGLGVLLEHTHKDAVTYGPNFDSLDNMPETFKGDTLADDTVHETYDDVQFSFNGQWDTDSRICMKGSAPYPATLLAMVFNEGTHDRG